MRHAIEQGANYQYVYGSMCYTWAHHMQQIAVNHTDYFFIHDVGHFVCNAIYEGFEWGLFEAQLDLNPIVILSAHSEGPSWLHVQRTVEHMVSHYGIDPKRIILWTGSAAEGLEPITVATSSHMFVTAVNEADIIQPPLPTHHYAMLARIPRPHRVKTAVKLLERSIDQFGKISCGSGNYSVLTREPYDKYVPEKWQKRFPMLLDGYIMHADIRQYSGPLQLTEITGAFCQIILESSHEWNSPEWTAPFLTEKSGKCMAMRQVPIWVGAVGQAKMARDLGFDLFDDLVDHSYDSYPYPDRRLDMAVDQLELICRMPLSQLQEYRVKHAARFDHNYELFLDIRRNLADIHHKTIVAALDKCKT